MIEELLFELYKLFIYSVYAYFMGSLAFMAVFSILERHFPSYFQRDVSEESFRDLSQASCFGLRNGEYGDIRKASQKVISHLALNRRDRYLRSERSSGYGFKIFWSICFFWVYPVVLVIPPMEMLSYVSRSQSTSYLEVEADYFLKSLWNIVVDIQDRDYEALEYQYSKYLRILALFKILIRFAFKPADFAFNKKLLRIWLVKFILVYDYGLGGVFDRYLTMIGYIFSFSFWLVSLSYSVQLFVGGIVGSGMGANEFLSIYVIMLSIVGIGVSFY